MQHTAAQTKISCLVLTFFFRFVLFSFTITSKRKTSSSYVRFGAYKGWSTGETKSRRTKSSQDFACLSTKLRKCQSVETKCGVLSDRDLQSYSCKSACNSANCVIRARVLALKRELQFEFQATLSSIISPQLSRPHSGGRVLQPRDFKNSWNSCYGVPSDMN